MFDNQHLAAAIHTAPALAQQIDAILIGPVMKNPLQKVHIHFGRNGLEHVTGNELDTTAQATEEWLRFCVLNDMSLIKQNAADQRIALQNQRELQAETASYVADLLESGKVVGFRNGGTFPPEKFVMPRKNVDACSGWLAKYSKNDMP